MRATEVVEPDARGKAAKEPVERAAERAEAAAKVVVEAGQCVAAALLAAEGAWFRVWPEQEECS